MHIKDIFRLATSNISQYKRRSLTVIITVAITFGLVIGLQVILAGCEKLLIDSAFGKSGKVYVRMGYNAPTDTCNERTLNNKEEANEKISNYITKYNGKIVGKYDSQNGGVIVIDKPVAEKVISKQLGLLPEDKINIIVSSRHKDSVLQKLPSESVNVVGEFNDGDGTTELATNGFNPINLLVDGITKYFRFSEYYIIDNETAQVYVDDLLKKDYENHKNSVLNDPLANEIDMLGAEQTKYLLHSVIAEFDNYDDVKRLYDSYNDIIDEGATDLPKCAMYNELPYGLGLRDFSSDTLNVIENMERKKESVILPVTVILSIIAIVVSILTFTHLVESDMATISLYRAMGASIWQVYLIYFIYLLELCLLALLASMVVGLLLVSSVFAINVIGGYGTVVQEFFNLSYTPVTFMFGLDNGLLVSIGLILLITPGVMVLTSWRFTAKHVAKKLKEEA